MKTRHVGGARGVFVEACVQHDLCTRENDAGLFDEGSRFRLHKSKPSRRISCISGLVSR